MPAPAEQPESSTPAEAEAGFQLRRLEIENFKAIENLTLEFPAPLMEDDPDVFVIGSRNGVGKTSILEACVLLLLRPLLIRSLESERYSLRDYFIRAGTAGLRLQGILSSWNAEAQPCELVLPADGAPTTSPAIEETGFDPRLDVVERFTLAPLFGAAPEPLILGRVLYFHSNRRMPHGPVSMDTARRAGRVDSVGWIKHRILRFLLAQAGLFENIRASSVEETARVFEELFKEFADAKLAKLRTQPNNALDIRVQPLSGGESFSVDALSSGQKEMITTLFLIWHHTRDNPALVLIDEPELHLNAEWQVKFVRLLFKLAPRNQYIFATHSEFIFRSVQEDRRILIGPQG